MNSKFTQIVRILLGLILIIFGANKIYTFIPLPQPSPEAGAFMASLADTGYILTLVAIFEIIIGFMLKIWVPFAMLLLIPLSFNPAVPSFPGYSGYWCRIAGSYA